MSTVKINTCDKDWFGKDYVFYDGNGNPINILYDQTLEQYRGNRYMPENSSDTFKEDQLYIFERIKGFEYQQYNVGTNSVNTNELYTEKFQIFNTEGIEFLGNTFSVQVTKVESVNRNSNFYSKWVYGEGIDLLFPNGTEVKFNRPIFSLSSEETYTVVNSKQNAILIITSTDNKTFTDTIGGSVNNTSLYEGLTLSGVNVIKLYNYVDNNYDTVFPDWSEPRFYNKVFKDQKITIVNSDSNDGVVTVTNESLGDNYYSNFKLLVSDVDDDIRIEVENKTSNLNIYSGDIILNGSFSTIELSNVSDLLKTGTSFTIPTSVSNSKILSVSPIPNFNQVNTYYDQGSTFSKPDQVIYENKVYECVQSYTQSATSSITPLDTTYWTESNFRYLDQNIVSETLSNADVFLTSNKILFEYIYDNSLTNRVNLAKCFESFRDSFIQLGLNPVIDPLGYYAVLESIFPTDYIDVKFYLSKLDTFSGNITDGTNFSPTGYTFSYDPTDSTNILVKLNGSTISVSEDFNSTTSSSYFSNTGTSSSLGFDELDSNTGLYWKEDNAGFGLTSSDIITIEYETESVIKESIIERVIEVKEDLIDEVNENYSTRNERRIVLNDIDEFGFKVFINDEDYSIDSTLLFDDQGDLDLGESIDKTLRNWVNKWKNELDKRGIFISTEIFGLNKNTALHNSVIIRGYYPNVEVNLRVSVGETANFELPDSYLTFYQLGGTSSILNININNISYTEPFSSNIETTLSNWVSSHTEVLNNKGIYITNFSSSLYFYKKEDIDINLDINLGRLFLPGEKTFEIIKYWKGNEGLILSSNRISQDNTDISFEEECFSTGQIISINNSEWVLNNQEYNVLYLNPNDMVLSYQGPFWGSSTSSSINAFFQLSFGDKLNVGDSIIAIVNGNTVTGVITKVSSSTYQIIYDTNKFATISRSNAWGYDIGASNSNIPSQVEDVNYYEVDSDLKYIEYYSSIERMIVSGSSSSIYSLDKEDLRIKTTLGITGSSLGQISNPINNLVYILTPLYTYIIDPSLESIKQVITNFGTGYDIEIDTTRGDVYVSYTDTDRITKIDPTNFSTISTDYLASYNYGRLTYSKDDDFIYVFSRQNLDTNIESNKYLYRINLNTNTRDVSFSISGSLPNKVGISATGSGYLGDDSNTRIHYNEFNGDLYISDNLKLSLINTSSNLLEELPINISDYYSVELDPFNKIFWISSEDGNLYGIQEDGNIITNNISNYGYLLYNNYDSNLYISSQDSGTPSIYVYSTLVDSIFYTFELNYELDRIVHNSFDNTIVGINNGTYSQVVEAPLDFIYDNFKSFFNVFNTPTYSTSTTNSNNDNFGSFSDGYEEFELMYLSTRDSIRKPRKNYETTGSSQVKWEISWEDTQLEDFFLFDISGDHLPSSGAYAYTGDKPLPNPSLRRVPNTNVDFVSNSSYQQTIFDTLSHVLEYNDSSNDISFIPEGIQTFVGFNSKEEGVVSNVLCIKEIEDISFSIPTFDSYSTSSVTLPAQNITLYDNLESGYGEIILSTTSTTTFDKTIDLTTLEYSNTNLDNTHLIKISFSDPSDQYVSNNNNVTLKIVRIFERKLVVEYLDRKFENESSNTNGRNLTLNIEVIPKVISKINYYGQTEIEDIRYKTELTNTGRNINPEDVYIFKEYDINEGGLDWKYLNAKRREMLTVRNDIFNYIGSYKSLINAINFFGYNDLELYEYFRNIDPDSESFQKLSKIEIPDIFDNSVEGWTENYKKYQYPNKKYEDTKLFNLTYRITDFEGNKLITYSLEEAIIKLSGLKKWLEKNIVPLTHKILDITGRVDFRSNFQIYNTPSMVSNFIINDSITPIDFDVNESYVSPIQSGSTVYTNLVEFKVGSTSSMVDYFTLNIKTYKTYDQWDVFTSYNHGDKVDYFGKIYENVLTDPTAVLLGNNPTSIKNVSNNPRQYEDSNKWGVNTIYEEGNIVVYKRRYYEYSLKTETVNYLPYLGASETCLVGTPSTTNDINDNFYNDLLDRIGNEEIVPSYWTTLDNTNSNFDVLDIIKENYVNSFCDVINRDINIFEQIAIDLINLPEEQYVGDKPKTKEEAKVLINNMVNDYLLIKSRYKYKFISLPPEENVMLDNDDFILWDDITKWIEVDIEPVQNITEYRSGDDMLLPFHFTLDSKIDPYVIISCLSDNGYGQIKNIKKSYELRFNADSDSVLIKKLRDD